MITDPIAESIRQVLLPAFAELLHNEFQKQTDKQLSEKFLSVDEARKMFQPEASRGTLYNWEDKGLLNSYIIGGKRLYRYSELIEAVTRIKRYSRNNDLQTSK